MYCRYFINSSIKIKRAMSTFVVRVNPTTGKQEWVQQSDNYDYHQEIARSAYADMLHDTERNVKYEEGLKSAIREMKRQGREVHVLDIGTGTGLLSMMAARHGADKVTACEAFTPMASCAKEIIKANGFEDKITIIPKRSTEICVGKDCDMEEKANILVTEVFDTELIGEGGIETFHHAHKELLQKECIVVPTAATMYAQVVESPLVARWNTFPVTQLPDGTYLSPPETLQACLGTPSVHDLQLTQLTPEQFGPVSDPVQVFWFDYSGKSQIKHSGHSVRTLQALRTGTCHAVFMWWDLTMDHEGKILLSCAPEWAHPVPSGSQWRDHWMQAIYYPESPLEVTAGQKFDLHSCHDDYSLWFHTTSHQQIEKKPHAPACTCGAHIAYSRSRLAMLSDPYRISTYWKALQKVCDKDSTFISLSQGSLLPLLAARLGAKKVYVIEPSPAHRHSVKQFSTANQLHSVIEIINKAPDDITSEDVHHDRVDGIIGEPFFSSSLLPWDNLYYWYAATALCDRLGSKVPLMPAEASLHAVPVQFTDLWKIRAPVKNCQGFDLTLFDSLIQGAIERVDACVEPQPLWEYPAFPLGPVTSLLRLQLDISPEYTKQQKKQGSIPIQWPGECNGIALWMDFHLDESNTITTGLLKEPQEGSKLCWDMYSRQGVHLFRTPTQVKADVNQVLWEVDFDPKEGNFTFKFDVS